MHRCVWHLLFIALFTCGYILFSFNGGSLGDSVTAKTVNRLFWTGKGWFWMRTLVAWAKHWFTKINPALRYLNGAVFCFYILHQTLIIVVAYYFLPKKLDAFIEPLLIIISVVISCFLLYELIKHLQFLRIFFWCSGEKSSV